MERVTICGQCASCGVYTYRRDEWCLACGERTVRLYPLVLSSFSAAAGVATWTCVAAVLSLGAPLVFALTAVMVADWQGVVELGGGLLVLSLIPASLFWLRVTVVQTEGRSSGRAWAAVGAITCIGLAFLYFVLVLVAGFGVVMTGADCPQCPNQAQTELFGLFLGVLLLGFAAISGLLAAAASR